MRELERFRPLARAIAADYFLPGADRDDVEQEAMLGAWKGLRDYRPGHGTTLASFVALCARRQVLTAVTAARREKHEVLNGAVTAWERNGELATLDVVSDERADPVRILAAREEALRLLRVVAHELSPLERRAVIGYANGLRYQDLGPPKSVDNALVRARRKLADPFEEAA